MRINSINKFLQAFFINIILYYAFLRIKFLGIVFLDGLLGILVSIFILLIISLVSSQKSEKNFLNKFFTVFLISLNPSFLIIAFHLIYPVSLDRSISVYTLSYVKTYFDRKEFNDNDINKIIKNGFLKGKSASKRRINEQIKVGNFKRLKNGNLILTRRGNDFVNSSRFSANLFGLSKDYLWPTEINID